MSIFTVIFLKTRPGAPDLLTTTSDCTTGREVTSLREPRERSVSHQAAQRAEVDCSSKNRPGAARSRSQESWFELTFDSPVHYLILTLAGLLL